MAEETGATASMQPGAARFVERLTKKSEDISRWYTDVILKAELADYAPVRGCMVIRPYGYALWENMQRLLDERIKATGHQNAYFPLFIPESLLRKEAEHVQGFAPQVAWVTHAGDEELEERLVVRPTSEAIIGTMYSRWIQSWRDLPVLINQWCNVVRWEKRTFLFLRTTEFLWQEGHTAHRTEEEAQEEVMRMLGVYRDFVENDLAVPVIPGRKTEQERFAGAKATYTIEALMPDGRALQAGTSHNLGQHFAKVFDITFLDQDGQRKYVWQTSWGVSTRLIGGLILVHGDDFGLKLPPKIAPVQLAIVPIFRTEAERATVAAFVEQVQRALREYRIFTDWREQTPGWKFNEWELRGAPLRVEVGPRDVQQGQVVLVRRDTRAKEAVTLEQLPSRAGELLALIQRDMLAQARTWRDEHTTPVETLAEFEELLETKPGFLLTHWCGSAECETAIKEKTRATIRCIPLDQVPEEGRCIWDGRPSNGRVLFARSY
jgi:prolyl-tRNA synthetase